MAYLRNAWYVAAWDSEIVAGQILSRRLLEESIVLFRDEDGEPKALHGVCPHRMAPLGLGRLVSNGIQCGYHGLTFDFQGACIRSPFGSPPKNVGVKSYPVVERYSAIWIWMGDPTLAEVDEIPDFGFQDPAIAFVGKEYLNIKVHYELEIENILDLSHIEFLHPTTLGSGQVSTGIYQSKQDGDTVWSNRDITNEVMSDHLSSAFGIVPGTPADRWIHVRWTAPANLALFSGAVPTGTPIPEGLGTGGAHLFTPETEHSSHYWFSTSVPKAFGPEGSRIAESMVQYLKMPFETEDRVMLEGQQRNVCSRELHTLKLAWLPGDVAGARARTILHRKIEAEASASIEERPMASAV